jgi:hypothetical protein
MHAFHSQLAVNALQKLARLSEQLTATTGTKRCSYYSTNAIDSVLVELGKHVVDSDDLRISVGSEEELLFRVTRLIVHSQLCRLDHAIRQVSLSEADWHAALWVRLHGAVPLAKAELWRITRLWLPYRTTGCADSEVIDARAYRAAIDKATAELRTLDQIPDVERLLYRGVASTHRPEIAGACERILAATHVRIDLPALRRLWSAHRAWATALGGARCSSTL